MRPRGNTSVDPLINRASSSEVRRTQQFEAEEEEHTLPEITVRSMLVMVVLSAILSSANAYLGLFAGMTISVSIPAAILSMAIIYPTGGNILEINAVQTGASSGSSIASGIIYTIPAIAILAFDDDNSKDNSINYWQTSAIAIIGGVLGIMFSIPLRRALIGDNNLRFPEGVATAEVLRLTEISEDRPTQVLLIGVGALFGFVIKFLQSGLLLWAPLFEVEALLGGYLFYFGTNLSPALISVGYIVGLPTAIVMLMGGIINYWIVIPILHAKGYEGNSDILWNSQTRFIGVGAMLLGGFGAIISLYPNLASGIKSAIKAYRQIKEQGFASVKRTQRDIPIPIIGISLIVLLPAMFGLFMYITDNAVWMSLVMSIFMMIFGFIFSAVGAYMSGVVGSSNNPISGMTLATIITSSLLLLMFLSRGDPLGPNFAVLIGSVVCCAAAVAGDNLQDLKSGHIIGATPLKQQIMQLAGVLLPAVFIGPVVSLLVSAYGLRKDDEHPRPLLAPQAQLMASVSKSIFSTNSKLPWNMVGIGIGIAVLFVAADWLLFRFKQPFRLPVLAAALGMYLPFELAVPIVLGGTVMKLSKVILSKLHIPQPSQDICQRNGLLFAAGLITGEALVGIILAIPIVFAGKDSVAVLGDHTDNEWPGILCLVATMACLLLVVVGKSVWNRDGGGNYMTL